MATYVPPTAAELVPKSPEMIERVKSVNEKLDKLKGERLLSPKEASDLVDDGAMLVDVRTEAQVRSMTEGKTPEKAVVNPVDDWVAAGKVPRKMKGKKVVVTCTTGAKSALAWEFLTENGVDAYKIDGGFNAWVEAGLPTKVIPDEPVEPPLQAMAEGAVEVKVTAKKSSNFYVRVVQNFLKGMPAKEALEAKDGKEAKEALEAKEPVEFLRISGLGEAINAAISAATQAETEGLCTITRIQTAYPTMKDSSRASSCAQVLIDVKRK